MARQMPDVTAPSDDETFTVSSPVVGCDGGGGPLGHPMVYLRIAADGEVVCPYCSRRFILDPHAAAASGH